MKVVVSTVALMLAAASSAFASEPVPAPLQLAAMSTPAPGGESSNTSGAFALQQASTLNFQLEAARIAMQRTKNTALRDFARHLEQEHVALWVNLQMLADTGQIDGIASLDGTLNDDAKADLDRLRNASEAEFDQLYRDIQDKWLQQAVASLATEGDVEGDPELKTWASAAARKLQPHLTLLQGLSTPI